MKARWCRAAPWSTASFCSPGVPLAFWPVLVAQSAITIWTVALTLRAHRHGKRPLLLLGVIAALSLVSTLPWLASILLTDIFCGTGVLALYLLLMRPETLSPRERIGFVALVAIAAATHSATFAVLLGLLAAAICLRMTGRTRIALATIGRGAAALALGAALVFAADYAVAGRLAWTPGGFALSFGRMLQDGIVNKYLDAHCPNQKLTLCAYKDRLPRDADQWFWGSPLFDQLGRFAGLGKEMETIAVGSVVDYPLLQLETAAAATVRQLVAVHTGEGVVTSIWHTYGIIERFTPQLVPAMRGARQQQGGISFAAINAAQYPLALLSMALLPAIIAFAARKRLPAATGELAATVALAILANAVVCGAFSNPHDRYGARIVWLAIFAAVMALLDAAAAEAAPRLKQPAF